jgi:hypothetical protein
MTEERAGSVLGLVLLAIAFAAGFLVNGCLA